MNETNPEQQTMPARVVRWTQKLLDLSLRNRLLNVRDVKQVLPLACRDVARLEDQLASDETVAASLNGQYAAFGTIDEAGMAIVDKIVADYTQYAGGDMGVIADEAHMPVIESITLAD